LGTNCEQSAKKRNSLREKLRNVRDCFDATSPVPAVETLEKFARALEVPLYQLFYDSDKPPALPNILKRKSAGDIAWGSTGKDARMLERFRQLLSKTKEGDRKLLLFMAQKMARGKTAPQASGG
jgi:hypothetical protein